MQSSIFTDNSYSYLQKEVFGSDNAPREKYESYVQNWHKFFSRIYSLQSGASDLYIRHLQLVILTKWTLDHQRLTPDFSMIKEMFGWVFNNDPVVEELKAQYFNKSLGDFQQLHVFYPGIVSSQTRHALGEIYTPVELASLLLQHTLQLNPEFDWKLLDPACGSGTFLIALLRLLSENETVSRSDRSRCLKNSFGVDLNPLSIFTCKANLQIFCKRTSLQPPAELNILPADPLFDKIPALEDKGFDYIVGNPPWYNLAAVQNREYQERLKSLARQLGINPYNSANIPNIEIAALFLRRMAQNFLAPGGNITFLLPRNILKGSQNARVRYFHNLNNVHIWDFGQVSFFPVEFIAFFGNESRDVVKTDPSDFHVQYRRVISEKVNNNSKWDFHLQKEQVYVPILVDFENKNIARLVNIKILSQIPPLTGSPYLEKFHNGARLGPRSFLFVVQEGPDGKYVTIRPDTEEVSTSRGRWKYAPYDQARVHQSNLFQCVMSKFLFPFHVAGTKCLFLPMNGALNYDPSRLDSLSRTHFSLLSTEYESVKKKNARQETLWDYIAYNGKTTNPLQTRPLKVIYNAIGRKRVKAAVLKKPFLVDDSLYYFTPESEMEAYYLAAILNSNLVNFAVVNIKDERNIHKNPWQLPIPTWQDEPLQQKIGMMGKVMETTIQENLSKISPRRTKKEMETQILRWIKPDLTQLDVLMKQLLIGEC